MNLYFWPAVNSKLKHVKNRKCSKTFWPLLQLSRVNESPLAYQKTDLKNQCHYIFCESAESSRNSTHPELSSKKCQIFCNHSQKLLSVKTGEVSLFDWLITLLEVNYLCAKMISLNHKKAPMYSQTDRTCWTIQTHSDELN